MSTALFSAVYVPWPLWARDRVQPGAAHRGARLGVVYHHPYPHAVDAGAGLNAAVREMLAIDTYHRTPQSKIGTGIGYHFVITESGHVFEGRGAYRVGAHAAGNNTGMYGIAFLINGEESVPSFAALESRDRLIDWLVTQGSLLPAHDTLLHSDVGSTTCPGSKLSAFLRGGLKRAQRRILRVGSSGDDVKELQTLLDMPKQYRVGTFGPRTQIAVVEFQTRNGLVPDGIVGPLTFAKLYS
jgi:hypothetical protein